MFIFIVILLLLVAVGGYFYLQQKKRAEVTTEAETTDAATTDAATTDAAKTDAATTDAAKTDAATTDAAKTDTAKTDATTTQAATTVAPSSASVSVATSSVASNSSSPIVIIPAAGSEVSALTTSPSPVIGTPVTTPSSSPMAPAAPQSTVDKLKQKLKDEQAAFAAKSAKDKAKTVALGAATVAFGGLGLTAVAASKLLPTATKDAIKDKAAAAKNKISSLFRRR